MSTGAGKKGIGNSSAPGSDAGPEKELTKKEKLEKDAIDLILENMVTDQTEEKVDAQGRTTVKKLTRKEVEESRMTHKQRGIISLRKTIKINDTFAAFLGIGGMVVALLEYEIYHAGDGTFVKIPKDIYANNIYPVAQPASDQIPKYNVSNALTTSLRSIVTISTLLMIVPLFFHMILNHKLAVLSGKSKPGENVIKTSFFRSFIFEVLLTLIHCPPFIDATFTFSQISFFITYSLDLILSNMMILRIYLSLRLFAHYTKWRSPLSMKYCEMEGCEANTVFAMKAFLKESPYFALLIAFIVSALILGIPVKNFEQPLHELNGFALNFTLWNSVWCIVITMTTVGFGDFFCRSHMGRFACVISIFWGIFLTSMMVVTLTNSMTLDAKETRAFNILYRVKGRTNLLDKATFIVTLIVRAKALANDFYRRRDALSGKKKEGGDGTNPGEDTYEAELAAASGVGTRSRMANPKIKELEEKYDADKAELFSKLDLYKNMYREAAAAMVSADVDPVEEIRKLSSAIEHDFSKMRAFFIAVKEIEANLKSIIASNLIIEQVIDQCLKYNDLFNKEILEFKGGIFNVNKGKDQPPKDAGIAAAAAGGG